MPDDSRAASPSPQAPTSPRQYPCSACGANLEFAPGTTALKCPYCGHAERIPQTADEVEEQSYEVYLKTPRKPLATLGSKQVKCKGCGAVTATDARSQSCPFCGVAIVVDDDPTELIAPEAVLPFRVSTSQARDLFKKWIGSRWFAPSSLKQLAAEEKLYGVYLPYWTYDSYTKSFYTGERGDAYWVTESYTVTVNGKTEHRTRQVRKIRWSPAAGTVQRWFDDVLIAATTRLPAKRLADLEPWDLKALEPYRPEFLPGFIANRYDVDLPNGFELAKGVMASVIHGDCCHDIGGDEQRVHSVKTAYSAIAFKHVLLPVWMAAYRFRNKTWQVFVNARSGEVTGDRPYSVAKIVGFVLLCLVVAGGIALIVATLNK